MSTVRRLCEAASRLQPALGDPDLVLPPLLAIGADALAPESLYAETIDRRRRARWMKRDETWTCRTTVPIIGGVIVRVAEGWVDSDLRRRIRVRYLRHDELLGLEWRIAAAQVPPDLFDELACPPEWQLGRRPGS
jgi:hypothetical protein